MDREGKNVILASRAKSIPFFWCNIILALPSNVKVLTVKKKYDPAISGKSQEFGI